MKAKVTLNDGEDYIIENVISTYITDGVAHITYKNEKRVCSASYSLSNIDAILTF